MINENNIKFLARHGSKSMLHDIVDNHGLSGSLINHIGNNPNADPEIGSKIKAKEGYLYPHHHNLYDPSEAFESTLRNTTDIQSYLDHPKHTEDDLIRLGEAYRYQGITFRPRNAGKKVFEHMVNNRRIDFSYDLANYSANKEIHEAALNNDSDMKHGLRARLSWNGHVDPDLQVKLFDDPQMGKSYAQDMITRSYVHPKISAAAISKYPDLSSQFVYHHGWDRENHKKAFEIIDAQNKTLYQDAHKEFLE